MTDSTGSNPFAETPEDPQEVVDRVRKRLEVYREGEGIPVEELDKAAEEAVEEVWDNPVQTFAPVLGEKAAKDRIDAAYPRPEPEPIGPVDPAAPGGDEDALGR